MTEVWLHSNRRVLLIAMLPMAALAGVGVLLLSSEGPTSMRWLGIGCLAISGWLLVGLYRQVRQPRIAYRDGNVLFYLQARGPIAVPVAVVEAFFQGEGPAHLPGESRHHTKSVNLIARLSQRESTWREREVKAALGHWAEGYVTIRGTWCEPLDAEVIRRLNRRLKEVATAQPSRAKGRVET